MSSRRREAVENADLARPRSYERDYSFGTAASSFFV